MSTSQGTPQKQEGGQKKETTVTATTQALQTTGSCGNVQGVWGPQYPPIPWCVWPSVQIDQSQMGNFQMAQTYGTPQRPQGHAYGGYDNRQCWTCGKMGHTSRTCWALHPVQPQGLNATIEHGQDKIVDLGEVKSDQAATMDENPYELNMVMQDISEEQSLVAGSMEIADERSDGVKRVVMDGRRWMIDSGASSHYCRDKEKFRLYTMLEKKVKIITGKGLVWGIARGDVVVNMAIGKVVIKGVVLVPELEVDADLISVSKLMINGFEVVFGMGSATIRKGGKTWGVCKSESGGGLFYLEEYEEEVDYAMAAQCVNTQSLITWHRRLGHITNRTIQEMTTKVSGMAIGQRDGRIGNRNIDCIDCLKGTQHQIISRYPFSRATKPLERVSVDIAGPIKTPDCTWNYKYFIVYINHCTRYAYVFPLKTRTEAFRSLQIFKGNAENYTGRKIVTLQSDNAGEFLGKQWTKYCQDSGIKHITCAPYAPGMNSMVERLIKSLTEHASSMLWHANIDEKFWALAVKASLYLHNRTPCRTLNGFTPYEKWHGKPPHVGHVRIWGCSAWAAVPKERRRKWDAKSRQCILVGFYDVENLYQLWDVDRGELLKRRDVVFHEDIMGHANLRSAVLETGTNILGDKSEPEVLELSEENESETLEELYETVCGEERGAEEDSDDESLDTAYDVKINGAEVERSPRTYGEAMLSGEKDKWQEACDKEHEAMLKNEVYEWCHGEKGVSILPCR